MHIPWLTATVLSSCSQEPWRIWGLERREIRPHGRIGSQELLARKSANTGDYRRSKFGKRDLSKGQLAEGKGLIDNTLYS